MKFGPGQTVDGAAIHGDRITTRGEVREKETLELSGIILCSLQRFITKELYVHNLEFTTQSTATLAARMHSDNSDSQTSHSQLLILELSATACCLVPVFCGSGRQRPSPWIFCSVLYSVCYDSRDLLHVY